jgi:hypothetical protein
VDPCSCANDLRNRYYSAKRTAARAKPSSAARKRRRNLKELEAQHTSSIQHQEDEGKDEAADVEDATDAARTGAIQGAATGITGGGISDGVLSLSPFPSDCSLSLDVSFGDLSPYDVPVVEHSSKRRLFERGHPDVDAGTFLWGWINSGVERLIENLVCWQ